MFKAALISRWHPHAQKPDERYAKEFLSQPDCQITYVWDKNEQIAKEWAEEYGVSYSADLESVVANNNVDALIVTSSANDHLQIVKLAAKYHKHVFMEKVLSFSNDEAKEIRDIIQTSGIHFGIAYMRLGIPSFTYAKTLIDNGTLGTPVLFRCFCTHALGLKNALPNYWYDASRTGGGVTIDMGFNTAYLAQYIMGKIKSVSVSASNHILQKSVEDLSSCNVLFENGAMGVLDCSWDTSGMSVFELSVYGTKGSYFARFGSNDYAALRMEDSPLQMIDLASIPRTLDTPVTTWVKQCKGEAGDSAYNIDSAEELVRYMNAAYKSIEQEGKRINL